MEGIHVSVYGGERPHIGAISVVDSHGKFETRQFPGHRDAAISEAWAKAIGELGYVPVVVESGIHHDGLNKAGIQSVMEISDQLLSRLLSALRQLF